MRAITISYLQSHSPKVLHQDVADECIIALEILIHDDEIRHRPALIRGSDAHLKLGLN